MARQVIAAFIITDGRVNVLKRTVASFLEKVGPVLEKLIHLCVLSSQLGPAVFNQL